MLTKNATNRRRYGHPNGPDAGPTTAEVFEGYANQAIEAEMDRLADDGLESRAIDWMRADPARAEILAGWVEGAANEMLLARNDQARSEAGDRLVRGLKPWVEKYVDAWTDEQKSDFITDQMRAEEDR